jgi:diguanylate cyclase (GGDEF)-like protein
MKLPRHKSLAADITLIVLLASGLSLVVFTAAMMLFDKSSSIAQSDARLGTLADIVGQNSTAAVDFDDRRAAAQVLQALRKEPRIVSACLYNASGALFSAYYREASAAMCPRVNGPHAESTPNLRSVSRPILRTSEVVGTIYLLGDLRDLHTRQRTLVELSALLAVFSLSVGGIAGLLMQRRISKPISRLAHGMHEVTSGGTFESRAAVEGSRETMELAQEFNLMLAELERRDQIAKQAEAQLQQEASTDALTGLPNRRLFLDRLPQIIALAQREHRAVALLYLDLDGFKLVNDSLGHSVGDTLLCEVAERFKKHIRKSDTLARIGGDEFTVILSSLHEAGDANIVAQALLSSLTKPFRIEGHDITIGASIGVSTLSDAQTEGDDLLQQADSAMYAAKKSGRNCTMFFTSDMSQIARERLTIENELRGALERGEIYVCYQPEFSVTTGELVRFEALARWRHPTLGQITPDRFIPVAEESGLIHTIGAFVLEQACMEALKWKQPLNNPMQVAVNMSAIQFNSEDILKTMAEILNRTGIDPGLVQIELTESVMVGSLRRSAEKMRKMQKMGLSIAIDDFGTGYSCLSYLPELPINAIKIDRSFTNKLCQGSETVKMVRSMVDLAHSMEMRVIVEGVEDRTQLGLLREIGADEVQGFLLGRPGPNPSSLAELGRRSDTGLLMEGQCTIPEPIRREAQLCRSGIEYNQTTCLTEAMPTPQSSAVDTTGNPCSPTWQAFTPTQLSRPGNKN